jgi:hypothetical protein
MKKSVLLLLLVLLVPLGVLAQEITGTIVGNVKDATGAVIPNAKVAVINTDKNDVVRTVTTNASGDFIANLLPIGHYKVEVTADKFRKSVLNAIELSVSDRYVANFTLQIGSTTEEVVVEANPVQVELVSATATGLISGTEVRELSLNNRNYEQMVALMPGVSYGGGDQLYIGTTNPAGQANTVSFSINGARNSANNWTVDGADNVDRGSNLTLINYPSVDAIAEFKVLRGLYSPEYGRGAGQINVITRSGDNKLHGSAYEFVRNDAFSANDYFRKRSATAAIRENPAPLRYNDFGFTVGGPVEIPGIYHGKNKTFFFVSQEYRRVITYSTNSTTAPTADEKLGIMPFDTCVVLSADRKTCAPGGTLAKGTPLTSMRAIDPIAAAYIKDIWAGAPNPDNATTNSLVVAGRNVFNNRQDMVRLDHVFGTKLATFVRYINDTIPTEEPFGLFGPNSLIPGVATSKTKSPGRTWVTRATATLTPTLLLEGGYNYSRSAILSEITGLANPANSPDIAAATKNILPYKPNLARIPTISGAFAGISGYGPYAQYNRDHNVFGSLAWNKGNHAFKFGGSWHNYSKTENAGANNAGTFTFDSVGTITTGPNNAGQTASLIRNAQAWMNFLTGTVTSFSQVAQDITPYIRMRQLEMFAQDEWKLSKRLSVSYGVRYSYFPQPFNDNEQVLSNFDPSTYDPAKAVAINPATGNIVVDAAGNPTQGSLFNGLIYGSGTMKNSPYGDKVGKGTKGYWAPRLGIAYDPFGTGKTSIRTGYGMFVQSTLVGTYEQAMFNNPPYSAALTIPNTTLGNPAGAVPSISAVPKVLRGVQTTSDAPYTQQWSLDIQQELADKLMFDIGYYGSKDTHLLGIVDLNQPLPGAYVQAGISASALTGSNVTLINAIRPYKGFGSINAIRPWFGANYNSLQMSVEKRFKGKSMVKGNYTWSHGLTDSWSDRSNAPANIYDIHQNYGPTALDRRHVFTGTYIYELPFFQNQKGFLGHVLGGWQTSGIVSIAAGLPLNISGNIPTGGSASVDAAGQGCIISTSTCPIRPNMISDPNSGPHVLGRWFDTGAFVANTTPGTVGSSPSGAILGPGYVKVDMSLFKTFKVTEAANLQFRFETFNVMNHENFNTINTSFGSSLFGQVTGSRDPRLIQLGAKLQF